MAKTKELTTQDSSGEIDIQKLIEQKYGNIELSKEELFIIRGFIQEKGLSFFGNDFYIFPFKDWKTGKLKNQIITSIEGIRKCARKIGEYGLRFRYVNDSLEVANYPNSSKPHIIQAILTLPSGKKLIKDILFSEYCKKPTTRPKIDWKKTKDTYGYQDPEIIPKDKMKHIYSDEEETVDTLWQTKPFVMIQKVAEASVLRMGFNLGDMYVAEELPDRATEIPFNLKQDNEQKNTSTLVKEIESRENNTAIRAKKREIKELLHNQGGVKTTEEIESFMEKAKSFLKIKEFSTLQSLEELDNYVRNYIMDLKSTENDKDLFEDREMSTAGGYGND